MSKNRNSRMPGNMQYNRPSGGYQKNLYRQQMLANNVKQPKSISEKTIRYGGIAVGALLIILAVVLTVTLKWKGLLIAMVIAVIAAGGIWLFFDHKQKEMISYYKKIGMTEEMYISELRKRNQDVKQLEAARKAWRKVKEESIFEGQMPAQKKQNQAQSRSKKKKK